MKQIIGKQNGFALVYALVTLLVACVGGTAVLFMSQRGRIQATDYAKMRSSSLAASAALKACEGQFLSDPTTSLSLFRAFPAKTWLLGSTPSASERKVQFWSGPDSPEYAARILQYDSMTQMIVIEGIGYGSNGGRKKVVASYCLDGFKLDDRPIGTKYALYLGGSIENLNSSFTIKGNVYFSMVGTSDQHINSGGTKIIEGDLKTGASTNKLDFTEDLTVTGNALVQCRLCTQNSIFKIKGDAGFTNASLFDVNSNTEVRIDGNGYFTQTANFGFVNCIDGDNGGNTTVYYNTSKVSANRFKDFDNRAQITNSTLSYLESQLGFSSSDATFTTNFPSSWGSGVVKMVSGEITGPIVDNWWSEQQVAGKLYQNEWLVLKLKDQVLTNSSPGTFTKKVIIIDESYNINANGNWYNCSPESNTFIYVTGSGHLNNWGIQSGAMFRGMIFINSTNNSVLTYKFGKKGATAAATFYGVIHQRSSKFDLNEGSPLILDFSEGSLGLSAVQEIVNSGLLLAPGQTTLPPRAMTLVDLKIRPRLLNIQL